MEKRNRLDREKSPYLLQHRHNPVHWFPWGKEAFDAAKEEDKPIFLSIGYSTCYWCHVMEKDSFENDAVARVLNDGFISIKIDREERPDIDQIYMDAVVAMTGHGGWPLSAFLTQDLKPFFAGTFFPREQFTTLLQRINELWIKNRETIEHSAHGVYQALAAMTLPAGESVPRDGALRGALAQLSSSFDPPFGGFGPAPKFPPATTLMLLMRIFRRSGDPQAWKMTATTLEQMARGGIYDHLGGGFARYSTDERWLVPHFEKMLYDNALLARSYLEAAQISNDELFRAVAAETLNYVLRDMQSAEGGFYSAEDAGEVGREGEFYVWKDSELRALLSAEEHARISELYGTTPGGNFEHGSNVLNLQPGHQWSAKQEAIAQSAAQKLVAARSKRTRPHLDDKVLTAWNGLMISALCKGYQVLSEPRYLEAALKSARFIQTKLLKGNILYRRWRDGEAAVQGFLDDYAYMIQAAIDLYESTFALEWLKLARELQSVLDDRFWDNKAFAYFYTEPDASDVLVRKKELTDGATPSGSGVSALNLLRIYHYTFDETHLRRAEQIFTAAQTLAEQYPTGMASTLVALDFYLDRTKEIVALGAPDAAGLEELRGFLYRQFLPNKVVAFSTGDAPPGPEAPPLLQGKHAIDGGATFYICERNTCQAPTTDAAQAKALIAEFAPLSQ